MRGSCSSWEAVHGCWKSTDLKRRGPPKTIHLQEVAYCRPGMPASSPGWGIMAEGQESMSKPPACRRNAGCKGQEWNPEELRPVTKKDLGEAALHAHDDGTPRGALDLLQMDACRWIRPEDVAERSELTPLLLLKLLYRRPPLRAMAWFRLATLMHRRRVKLLPGVLQRRLLKLYGLELVPGTKIGGGLYIAHPVGCVIVVESMGTNVSLMSGVTFGRCEQLRWPIVGDNAFFGAGCRVLGPVEIGANAKVGANSVVLTDIPSGAVAVGVPARVLERGNHAAHRSTNSGTND
jgi:serine O-acetyltransferase